MKSLNQLKIETEKIAKEMPNPKKRPIHARLVELMEEVGELSNAIQTDEGYKARNRKKSDVADSICDVLFELLLIANYYNIDLDKKYSEVLKEIEKRRKNGDFDH